MAGGLNGRQRSSPHRLEMYILTALRGETTGRAAVYRFFLHPESDDARKRSTDPDLKPLWNDPRFKTLTAYARQRADAKVKAK